MKTRSFSLCERIVLGIVLLTLSCAAFTEQKTSQNELSEQLVRYVYETRIGSEGRSEEAWLEKIDHAISLIQLGANPDAHVEKYKGTALKHAANVNLFFALAEHSNDLKKPHYK